jgi:hypothetical protein
MLVLILALCGQNIEMPATFTGAPGQFIAIRPIKTDGKIVQYFPLDNGLSVFPAALLNDTTATVVTAVKPGKYRLLAYTALADKPSLPVIVTVVVGDGNPEPIPPVPVPTPKIDDETYGLGTFIYKSVDGSVAASASRKEIATAFAENFRVTASQIGAGTLTQVAKILQTVTEQNDATLSNLTVDKAKWEKSAVALQDELLKLNRDKKLVKPEDFRVAFLELSSGFAALAAK